MDLVIAACLALSTASASAQTIRGRVVLQDSVTPMAGIVVTAVGRGNVTATRALTTSAGGYVLRLPAAGTYEVRALRIGYRPTVVQGVAVADSAVVIRNIVLQSLPVALAGVDIRGDKDCRITGRDGAAFLQLWEQARGALAATQLWDESGALDVRVVLVDGHIDAKAYYSDSLYPVVDTLRARELIVDRVFASTSPESIAVMGYIRPKTDGRIVYDMPNAETILSDAFVEGHCFSIRRSRDHPQWIGFGFTPRKAVDGVVDVRGVLWLEQKTAELRRVEFEYANLPAAEYRICDLHPFVKLTPERLAEVPAFKQPAPGCDTHKNDRSNRLGLGGYANFVRLPGGEWLIAEWMVRTPPDEGRIRPLPWRMRHVKRRSERCWHGPDCHTVISMRPRLVTSTGLISSVMREGVRLYQNDSGAVLASAMAAKRSGSRPAALAGVVTDMEGTPLVNAVVQVEGPWLATHSDSLGEFRFAMLPRDSISLSVRCRGYQSVRLPVALRSNLTGRVRVSLPHGETVSRSMNCAEEARPAPSGG